MHQKSKGSWDKRARGSSIAMSQITVVVVPGRGTAESRSEGNGWDFQFLSSRSLCWTAAMALKSMGWEELRRALVSRWVQERASAAALRDPRMWRMSDVNWDGWWLWWSLSSWHTSDCSWTTSVQRWSSSGRGGRLAAGQKGGSLMVVAATVTGLLSAGVKDGRSSSCDTTDFEAFVACVRVTNYRVWRKVRSPQK